jgi:hypothetical protein
MIVLKMAVPAKTIVDSFREAVQDLLVPELKAMRVSMDSIRTEMQLRDEKLQESLEALRNEMQLRDDRTHEVIRALGQKLDFAIDIRERLAVLEARLPRQ